MIKQPIVKITSPDHKELVPNTGSGFVINIAVFHPQVLYVDVDVYVENVRVVSKYRCSEFRQVKDELPLACYTYTLPSSLAPEGSKVTVHANAFGKTGSSKDTIEFYSIKNQYYYYQGFSELSDIALVFAGNPTPGVHVVTLDEGVQDWPEFKSSGYDDITIEPNNNALIVIKGSVFSGLRDVQCNIGNCVFKDCYIYNSNGNAAVTLRQNNAYVKLDGCRLRGSSSINAEGVKSSVGKYLNLKSCFFTSFSKASDYAESVRFCKFRTIGTFCADNVNRVIEGNSIKNLTSTNQESYVFGVRKDSSSLIVRENYTNNIDGNFLTLKGYSINNIAIYGNTILTDTNGSKEKGLELVSSGINNSYIVNNTIAPNSSNTSTGFNIVGPITNSYLVNNFFNYDLTSKSSYQSNFITYSNNATKSETFGVDSISNVQISSFNTPYYTLPQNSILNGKGIKQPNGSLIYGFLETSDQIGSLPYVSDQSSSSLDFIFSLIFKSNAFDFSVV